MEGKKVLALSQVLTIFKGLKTFKRLKVSKHEIVNTGKQLFLSDAYIMK